MRALQPEFVQVRPAGGGEPVPTLLVADRRFEALLRDLPGDVAPETVVQSVYTRTGRPELLRVVFGARQFDFSLELAPPGFYEAMIEHGYAIGLGAERLESYVRMPAPEEIAASL